MKKKSIIALIAFFLGIVFINVACSKSSSPSSVEDPIEEREGENDPPTNQEEASDEEEFRWDDSSSDEENGDQKYVTVLQFNIWLDGAGYGPTGIKLILDEIYRYKPDFITFSEIGNSVEHGGNTLKLLCDSLTNRGVKYYYNRNIEAGVISRHPIFSHSEAMLVANKIVVELYGLTFAVYSIHTDFRNYAQYLPRGYDGSGDRQITPIVDEKALLEEDARSARPRQTRDVMRFAKDDIESGRIVIIGGDLNEASKLDWTERTKDMYDHNGAVVNWYASDTLLKAGYKDSYREVYPDEVKYPGFTWPVASPWIEMADERDRIDFIYYKDPGDRIKPVSSRILGWEEEYVGTKDGMTRVKYPGEDPVLLPQTEWPSDHRAVITKFLIQSE